MVNVAISALPAASALDGTELVPVVQGGTTSQSTSGAIADLANTSLFSQTQVVTVGNTAVETALTGTGVGSLTLGANSLAVGKTLKLWANGYHSAGASQQIRVRVKLGATVVADTGTVNSGSSTNTYWELRMLLVCTGAGAGGHVNGQGFYEEAGGGPNLFGMVNQSAVALDTTASHALTVTVQWTNALAGNTITCTTLLLEMASP